MKINKHEAPSGFYAVLKSSVNKAIHPNVCTLCDARKLCCENKDDWCLLNRCMSHEITAFKDNKTYSRSDDCSVFFRKMPEQQDLFGEAV
ncbi:hypothetical protein [Acinetobacter seifertii]|uniref:hypothetical protein n=1 Tax=Acinetobacter seifertii TaxID=1530123 RepID=UPI003F5232AF